MFSWILLGYTVRLRAAPQPLQRPFKSENETVKRAKTKRGAADAQHSVEGKKRRNHHAQMSALSSFFPDDPDQLAFSRHISHPATKEMKIYFDVSGVSSVFLYSLHVTKPEINLQRSWFITSGSLNQWFPNFLSQITLTAKFKCPDTTLNGHCFGLTALGTDLFYSPLLTQICLNWTQFWFQIYKIWTWNCSDLELSQIRLSGFV